MLNRIKRLFAALRNRWYAEQPMLAGRDEFWGDDHD